MIQHGVRSYSQIFHSSIVRVFVIPIALPGFFLLFMICLVACSKQEQERAQQTSAEPVAANAQWVGSEACAPCHAQFYNSFRQTGMGRSFSRPDMARLTPLLKTSPLVYERKSDFHYSAHLREGRLIMREFRRKTGQVIYQQERAAAYQVGSGNNTISFLEERNGHLFEMPLTWYAEKKLWDMSPGYRDNNWRFDRPINSTCLNCHTAPSRLTPQTENHYENVRLGIGCENCHGPGSVHVEVALHSPASQANFEQTIVHPADLDRPAQMDICQRCHLEGIRVWNDGVAADEFKVGQKLSAQQSIFVNSDAHASESEFGIAAQADRLRKSACYQKSATMTCTTCHDPHQSTASAGADAFNAKCMSCHGGVPATGRGAGILPAAIPSAGKMPAPQMPAAPACTAPQTNGKNMQDCIRCHMKAGETSDIPHVRFTDHYIRRDIRTETKPQLAEHGEMPYLAPLLASDHPAEKTLQQGLAYLQFQQTRQPEPAYLDSAIYYLEKAAVAGAHYKDGEADYALGSAYYLKNEPKKAEISSCAERCKKIPAMHARTISWENFSFRKIGPGKRNGCLRRARHFNPGCWRPPSVAARLCLPTCNSRKRSPCWVR
jgi:predicted CXXCH cytochrome family protein